MTAKTKLNLITTAFFFGMLLALTLFFVFLVPAERVTTLASPTGVQGVVSSQSNTSVATHTVRTEPRLRYRLSVIPGGVATAEEFKMRIAQDPVLKNRFAGCADFVESTATDDLVVFTTFRRGNEIKWNRRPIAVKRGEKLLIGCHKTILSRCGNEISWTPQNPSEDLPPGTLENPINSPQAPPIVATPQESAPPYFQPGGPIETTEGGGPSAMFFGGFGGGFGPPPATSVAMDDFDPSVGILVFIGAYLLFCADRIKKMLEN